MNPKALLFVFLLAAPPAAHADAPGPSRLVSASGLLRAQVTDLRGQPVGVLRELSVDLASRSVAYAVVDFDRGPVPEVGLRAVPLQAFRPGLGRDRLALDPARHLDWNSQAQASAEARLLRASTLIGMPIDHPSGADYGRIFDLRIEFPGGRVSEASVALEHPSSVRVDVPFSALRVAADGTQALITLGTGGAP
jgi:sporulation protein YlmC with PRC-barrel domain